MSNPPRDSVLKRSRVAAGVAQPLRHPPPTPRLLPLSGLTYSTGGSALGVLYLLGGDPDLQAWKLPDGRLDIQDAVPKSVSVGSGQVVCVATRAVYPNHPMPSLAHPPRHAHTVVRRIDTMRVPRSGEHQHLVGLNRYSLLPPSWAPDDF
eukprot:COSAG02_NODE_893_length_16140_cov_19.677621_3_plen_150_part_00